MTADTCRTLRKLTGDERAMIHDEVQRVAAAAGADFWITRRHLRALLTDVERIIAARLATSSEEGAP